MCYKISMRKFFILLIMMFFSNLAFVQGAPVVKNTAATSETAQVVELAGAQRAHINYNQPVKNDKKNLLLNDEDTIKGIILLQQQHDLEDIELLWAATVENNTVVKFAMRKLATPESQRRIHSSLMAKTLSSLLSGAAFIPTFSGADAIVQSASFASARIASNLINKQNMPTVTPLTDTELIELAGMIENLQDNIISSYYNYKKTLGQIKETRSRLILYNKNYADAILANNDIEVVVSSALYDDLTLEETQLISDAKKYQLELQRLAGKKSVEKLGLYQYSLKDELINQQLINLSVPKNRREAQ